MAAIDIPKQVGVILLVFFIAAVLCFAYWAAKTNEQAKRNSSACWPFEGKNLTNEMLEKYNERYTRQQ